MSGKAADFPFFRPIFVSHLRGGLLEDSMTVSCGLRSGKMLSEDKISKERRYQMTPLWRWLLFVVVMVLVAWVLPMVLPALLVLWVVIVAVAVALLVDMVLVPLLQGHPVV